MALPPFINSTGLIPKIFEKIQQAKVPDRYTTDFQGSVLGYGSGSARPFIPFLKRLGFIESDGRPTEIYRKFRNSDSSGASMAEAMRRDFSDIFQKNEYAYKLTDDKLKNLTVEVTGKEPSDGSVTAINGSFKACKLLADFDSDFTTTPESSSQKIEPLDQSKSIVKQEPQTNRQQGIDLRLRYTVNINLSETTDVEVYNAIFQAIKQSLLKDD